MVPSAKRLPMPAIVMTSALERDWPVMLICLALAGCRTCRAALALQVGAQGETPPLAISAVVTMSMTAMQR
jgi:hypothetical protein